MKENARRGKRELVYQHKERKKKLATKNTKNTKNSLVLDADVPLPALVFLCAICALCVLCG
jgi:hypothetical protein